MNRVTRGRRRVEEEDRNCLCPAERALAFVPLSALAQNRVNCVHLGTTTEQKMKQTEEDGRAAQMKKDQNTCTDCSLPPPRSLARSSICVFAHPEASTQ
jgi:hypothetical protein